MGDVSAVTDMSELFSGLAQFNADISSWDTSGVTTMYRMFYQASAFNQPLSFDTSSVTTMESMFRGTSAFNQPLSFDTSSVTTMGNMFQGTSAFNQPLSFDTSSVTSMGYMFGNALAFNQPLSFDTSSVTNMGGMFYNAQTRSSTVVHGRATPSLSLGTVRLGAAGVHAESGWCVVEATTDNVHVFVYWRFVEVCFCFS